MIHHKTENNVNSGIGMESPSELLLWVTQLFHFSISRSTMSIDVNVSFSVLPHHQIDRKSLRDLSFTHD